MSLLGAGLRGEIRRCTSGRGKAGSSNGSRHILSRTRRAAWPTRSSKQPVAAASDGSGNGNGGSLPPSSKTYHSNDETPEGPSGSEVTWGSGAAGLATIVGLGLGSHITTGDLCALHDTTASACGLLPSWTHLPHPNLVLGAVSMWSFLQMSSTAEKQAGAAAAATCAATAAAVVATGTKVPP